MIAGRLAAAKTGWRTCDGTAPPTSHSPVMGKKRFHGRFGYAGNCALTSIEAVVDGADLETVIALPGALPTTVGKALVYGSDLPIPISDDLRAFVERAYARLGALPYRTSYPWPVLQIVNPASRAERSTSPSIGRCVRGFAPSRAGPILLGGCRTKSELNVL